MQKQLKIKLYLFYFFLISTIVFAISFPRLTLPFGFAYIVFLMVNPLTTLLTTGPFKQRIFYLVVLLLGILLSIFPVVMTLSSMDTDYGHLFSKLPEVQKVLGEKFFKLKVYLFESFGFNLTIDPVNFVMKKLENLGTTLIGFMPNLLSTFFEWLLLVPMFLYFFFAESERFKRSVLSIVPNSIFEKSYVLFSQFNLKFGEYIVAKFIEATILGSIVTFGLYVIGFPHAVILGFVAGITNILPYIGPVIGFVPPLFVALLAENTQPSILAMSLVFIVANLIDTVLVFPLMVSKIVNLNPIVVVVSIIVGSQLGGIVGMIVIIPFIAFFKILFKEIYKDLSVQ